MHYRAECLHRKQVGGIVRQTPVDVSSNRHLAAHSLKAQLLPFLFARFISKLAKMFVFEIESRIQRVRIGEAANSSESWDGMYLTEYVGLRNRDEALIKHAIP